MSPPPKPVPFEALPPQRQGQIVDYALGRDARHNDCSRQIVVEMLLAVVVNRADFGCAPLTDAETAQLVAIVDRRVGGYEPTMRLKRWQVGHALILFAEAVRRHEARRVAAEARWGVQYIGPYSDGQREWIRENEYSVLLFTTQAEAQAHIDHRQSRGGYRDYRFFVCEYRVRAPVVEP